MNLFAISIACQIDVHCIYADSCEVMIPNSGSAGVLREVLSPHKIAVLLFIEKYARIGLKQVDAFSQGKMQT